MNNNFVNEIVGGDGKRRYRIATEGDGRSTIVPDYTPEQAGFKWGANEANEVAEHINSHMQKSYIGLDSLGIADADFTGMTADQAIAYILGKMPMDSSLALTTWSLTTAAPTLRTLLLNIVSVDSGLGVSELQVMIERGGGTDLGGPNKITAWRNGNEPTSTTLEFVAFYDDGLSKFRQVHQGIPTQWVATSVESLGSPGVIYALTVPNFVFTEGCQVTFKVNASLLGSFDPWAAVIVNYKDSNTPHYSLRGFNGGGVQASSLVINTMVTVTLSSQKFPIGDVASARQGTAFYSGQQTPTNWVATSVGAPDINNSCVLTIPNFVFTEGCQITFKATAPPKNTDYCCVNIPNTPNMGNPVNNGWFALRTMQGAIPNGDEWIAGAWVTITLSTQSFNQPAGWPTAFFKAGGASTPKFPTYTGSHAIFGTEEKGYMELYGSGTLTPQSNMTVEAFLVGGGGGGGPYVYSGNERHGGGGGGGGYIKSLTNLALINKTAYPAVIGAGGTGGVYNSGSGGANGGTTSFSGNSAAGGYGGYGVGGNGGSGGGSGTNSKTSSGKGGNGGSNGASGLAGTSAVYAVGTGAGVSTIFNGKTYSGGGGGGGESWNNKAGGAGGAGGGGRGLSYGEVSALANAQGNTGGGGGGAADSSNTNGGTGGSGIIIIRWGY